MNILIIGDVCSKIGRKALEEINTLLRQKCLQQIDSVLKNK